MEQCGIPILCLQSPCLYPCCVCLSTALVSSACTSVHILVTHMRTHLPYDSHLSLFHSSGPACVCKSYVFSFHFDVIARLLTDLETRRFGIYFFSLVAGPRSSAMSGATGRRGEEHVPQYYGRIDEKFAEWETDVRLWQLSSTWKIVTDWDQGCIGEDCMDSGRSL